MTENTEKKTILIADDAKINRDILAKALKEEYNIIEACDGEETLKLIVENYKKLSVILLDINMPRINGFQVMSALNKKNVSRYLPIILITGDNTNENMRKGYEYGAAEFIGKPFDIIAVKNCITNIIKVYGEKNRLEYMTIRQNKELEEQANKLKKLNENIMDMMGTVVEFRGAESNAHIKRVKEFTRVLCETIARHFPEYNLTGKEIGLITAASCLHDVGKILIPDSILLKPAKLTADEYEIVKGHTTKGCEIIDALAEYQEELYHKYSYEICRYHHERFDGKGYPDKLSGDEIPLSAQIVSITEAFDALMINNVFRERMEFDEAFHMIMEGDCGIFAPKIVQCFQSNKERFRAIDKKYSESISNN